jgi:hypothetical protein
MSVSINSTTGIPYSMMNDLSINPIVIAVVVIIIILYYVLFASLGSSAGVDSGSGNGNGIVFIEVLLWGVFILLILLNGMAYIFNINIIASIKNLFSSAPSVDIIVDKDNLGDNTTTALPEMPQMKQQVFHVHDNKYDYEDSKAICQAYGGRLANYKEINDAYNEGADWCGFGWSEGQMALYPTQTEKWNTLQGIKGHEHDCGRPGINGGYIDNPNVRFGVNCFGYKPKITPEEAQRMMTTPLYPKTNTEIEFDKKVDYWRTKIHDIIVAPFNHNNWSVL